MDVTIGGDDVPEGARRTYAGIGSRETPKDVTALMLRTSTRLCLRGWTLRTGGAPGADQAFISGLQFVRSERNPNRLELYLPWAGFSGFTEATLTEPTERAREIAAQYHPGWPYLKRGVKSLIARNVHQVLGRECDDPVLMIVCWTPDGSLDGKSRTSGGTGMALRVATGEAQNALVFNLALAEHRERVESFCANA